MSLASFRLLHVIFPLLCNVLSYELTNWNLSTSQFTYADQNSFVVFDDIKRNIWIFGGNWNRERIYTYNIDTEILTDMTSIINPNGTINFLWNYVNNINTVIINRTIYSASGNFVIKLNIDTYEYSGRIIDIVENFKDWCMCMVTNSEKTKLYFTAGWYSKKFIIWDLLTATHTEGPLTKYNHKAGVCHVVDNVLYVMAGDESQFIEYIDLNEVNNNLDNAKWKSITATLPTGIYSASSARRNNLIFIMGGTRGIGTDNEVANNVYSFDTQTHHIRILPSLPEKMAWAPAICVESRIYIFMGVSGSTTGGARHTFMYSDLLLPTNEPTNDPTNGPTNEPTIHPTNEATNELTPTTDMDYVNKITFLSIVIMSSIFVLLVFISCIHSEYSYKSEWRICIKNGCHKSDQYNFHVLFKLLLRISDLITDTALAYTITMHYILDGTNLSLILSTCSILGIVLPYIINLLFAKKATRLKNVVIERPTIWFSKYMLLFIILTMSTGDCYVSTQVISSNLFGLNIFNCGFNRVQLNSIRRIKLINILFESIPQSIIQGIYGYYNDLTPLLVLSVLLSLLSSISNILSFCMTRHIDQKYKFIQYVLEVILINDDSNDINKKKELLQIIKYRGCTKILRNKISLILGIEVSKLQISCVDMIENGCNINIVQTIVKQNKISIHQLYENKYHEISGEIKRIYSLTCNVTTALTPMLIRKQTNTNIDISATTEPTITDESSPNKGRELEVSESGIEMLRYKSTAL